jgi:Mor family transcriptional regulator
MKPELRRQILEKLDSLVLSTGALFAEDNPDVTAIPAKQRKSFQKRMVTQFPQRMQWEKVFRMVPDGEFAAWMSALDEMPDKMLASLKDRIANMPKDHGGRPPYYPLAVRLQAVQEVGQETAGGLNFGEAVEKVAKRHEMSTSYLRRVWRNRKRLKPKQTNNTGNDGE